MVLIAIFSAFQLFDIWQHFSFVFHEQMVIAVCNNVLHFTEILFLFFFPKSSTAQKALCWDKWHESVIVEFMFHIKLLKVKIVFKLIFLSESVKGQRESQQQTWLEGRILYYLDYRNLCSFLFLCALQLNDILPQS